MSSPQKCYLLDTSVILDDPANILRISEKNQNLVVISNTVLAELNNKKDDMRSDAGFRAREFFRMADYEVGETLSFEALPPALRSHLPGQPEGDCYYRLTLPFDPSLTVDAKGAPNVELLIIYREDFRISRSYAEPKGLNDAKIAEIAADYNLILVTNDISFKIAAEVQGIEAESLRNASVERPDAIEFAHTVTYTEEPQLVPGRSYHNFEQITFVQEATSEGHNEIYETGLQRYALTFNGHLEWCDFDRRFGEYYDETLIRPINLEQKFYFYMLTHPQNHLTVVSGSTGSGKTLMALQAGLEMVKEGIVEGIVYARNTVTASDPQSELGFRKGDEHEKLGYFMYPLYSAINYTIEHQNKHSIEAQVEYTGNTNSTRRENATELFMAKYNIEVMDIAHMRGTTISRKFVIIDEAQNMTNATMKLIGTRMGDETRLVIMGDPHQIDHPFLSKRRNALVTMLNKAQHTDFLAGIQLRHTIRSEVANWFDKNL